MPHECTSCGELFPDGSKQMLSGCPACGSNKFQYRPTESIEEEAVTELTEDTAQTKARSETVDPDTLPAADNLATPSTSGQEIADSESEEQTDDDDSKGREVQDLDTLRDELNDQFESIKIVSPGQYELNLMELYDRDEYIISLLEDGRYAIEVPESWQSRSESSE